MEPSIRIGIIGAPRPSGVDTLNRTIESMRREDPVARKAALGVFWDGTSAPELRQPIDHIEIRDEATLATLRSSRYCGALNFVRAVRWCAEADIVVVSDDDMIMATKWLDRSLQLIEAAKTSGEIRPVLGLSHFYAQVDMFDETSIATKRDRLYAATIKTKSNGLFPVVTGSSEALTIASIVEESFSRVESDYAILVACRDRGAGLLFYVDPCIACHMNVGSNFAADRGPDYLYDTKRFCPF